MCPSDLDEMVQVYVLSEGLTKQVCPNVIDDDKGARQQEPDEAVKDVADKEAGGNEHHQQDHVGPSVLPKLIQVHPFLQLQDKCHKACMWTDVTRLCCFSREADGQINVDASCVAASRQTC